MNNKNAVRNATNIQSKDELSQLTGLVPIVTAIVGISSGFAVWVTHRYQKKQYKLNALMGVFDQLISKDHREAREKVYHAYKTHRNVLSDEDYFEKLEDDEYKQYVEIVCSDFDQMGALIKNSLIDKSAFLDVYGNTTQTYWNILRVYVLNKRKTSSRHTENFEWLADEATKRAHCDDDKTNEK